PAWLPEGGRGGVPGGPVTGRPGAAGPRPDAFHPPTMRLSAVEASPKGRAYPTTGRPDRNTARSPTSNRKNTPRIAQVEEELQISTARLVTALSSSNIRRRRSESSEPTSRRRTEPRTW